MIVASYLGLGLVLLICGCIWNRSYPRSAYDWAFSLLFVCLYPIWFAALLKEKLS